MNLNVISLFVVSVCVALAIPGGIAAQTAEDASGLVVEVEVPAPSLAGNLLGTPDVQSAAVYLPPGYDQEPERRFPVIYLLHGIFDDYVVWSRFFDVPARLDRLVQAKAIPELIVVMPNGGNLYGGGFYRNSPVSGNWGDYIAEDLVAFVDSRFRTLASGESRAIVGHSMGGYGALHLAMTRPGVFSAVWAMSPCCLAVSDDLSLGNDAWKRAAVVGSMEDLDGLYERRDYIPIAALGVATAFGTEAGAPPIYAQFPFEIVRGEVVVDEAAYDRHLDAFPVRSIDDAREALRGLRGLGIGVGLGDQFLHIPPTTLEFTRHLGAERIPYRLDVYAGDHRELVGDRLEQIVLPWVGALLTTD